MLKVEVIEFQYKGERDYIHGTDMFNRMIAAPTATSATVSNIRFTVHDFVHNSACQLYSSTDKQALQDIQNIRARCQFKTANCNHWLALTEQPSANLPFNRYAYDEDRVIGLCRRDAESLSLTQQSPFTFIETIVAMNKHLHQLLFPELPGKWIFTRIDLDAYCDVRESLTLQLKHNMSNRLTKSAILVNQQQVGDLYFSLFKS